METAKYTTAAHRQSWFLAVLLVGAMYTLVSILFALPDSNARAWRLATWVMGGVVFALHVWYERFRLRHSPLSVALHVAFGAALGGFGLAVGAIVHALSVNTNSEHQRLLLIALVVWPILTGVPAFLLGLGASGLLARFSRRAHV